jgi:hypothetical protein
MSRLKVLDKKDFVSLLSIHKFIDEMPGEQEAIAAGP